MSARQTEASRLFDELNRRYWRGRLPPYRVLCVRCGPVGFEREPWQPELFTEEPAEPQ
jgi:hypothetical protein